MQIICFYSAYFTQKKNIYSNWFWLFQVERKPHKDYPSHNVIGQRNKFHGCSQVTATKQKAQQHDTTTEIETKSKHYTSRNEQNDQGGIPDFGYI